MRLGPAVHYISFPIYRFTSYSCVAIYLKNFAGRCKLIDTMSAKGKYSILTDAVLSIRSDTIYGPRLSDCWLPASTWVEALQELNLIDASIAIDVRKFNTAMSKSPLFGEKMSRFDGSNTTGVFRVTFQNKFFYYFTQESNQVRYPVPLNGAWKDKVMAAASNVLVIPSTRARPALTRVDIQVADTNTAVTTRTEDGTPSPQKRPRIEMSEFCAMSYWPDSPEARQVFQPRNLIRSRRAYTTTLSPGVTETETESDESFMSLHESAQEAVERRIELLKSVNESEEGWRNVIVVGRDADDYCTKREIFEIRQRSTFLSCAYQIALEHMNQKTWHQCCKEACKLLNSLGMMQATYFITVANWNKVFRQFDSFPHPNPYVQCGKRPLPPLLEIFPEAKEQIVSFGIQNLATLTIESVHDLIVSKIIPELATTWKKEVEAAHPNNSAATISTSADSECSNEAVPLVPDDNDTDREAEVITLFLKAHRLETVCLSTTWRWMKRLGYKHSDKRKSFYVDGHERDDVMKS